MRKHFTMKYISFLQELTFSLFCQMQNIPLTLAEKSETPRLDCMVEIKKGREMPLNPNKTSQISHYITYKKHTPSAGLFFNASLKMI